MGALKIVVFICGACVMVLELVGSRLFAPYLGTSLFIWTSLIGVILGCLSVGYWAGGKLADKKPEPKALAGILFISGLLVALIALAGDRVLFAIQSAIPDIRVGSVAATLTLFGLPSVLLGMVSPYAVRLSLSRIELTGSTAGGLYALSTLGSIAGTFLAGFFLMTFFSHRAIFFMISLTLLAMAGLAFGGKMGRIKAAIAFLAVLGSSASEPFVHSVMGEGFVEAHTAYNRVWIYDAFLDGHPARVLQLNDSSDSAMYLDSDELALDYTKYFRLAEHFRPGLRKTLMIGGGAYSFTKYLLKTSAQTEMDAVEIDSELTELARKHFGLTEDPRLRIFHEDARIFLNRGGDRYDAVFGDVYKSYSIPFHLATREAMQKIHGRLTNDGVFVLNVISSAEGPNGRFLRAMLATMDEWFPQILVFAVEDPEDGRLVQNFALVAFKTRQKRKFVSEDPELNRLLSRVWVREIPRDKPVLTDALAPVEEYATGIVAQADRKNSILRKKLDIRRP